MRLYLRRSNLPFGGAMTTLLKASIMMLALALWCAIYAAALSFGWYEKFDGIGRPILVWTFLFLALGSLVQSSKFEKQDKELAALRRQNVHSRDSQK